LKGQAVLAGDGQQLVHRGGVAGEVHRDDGARACRDFAGDVVRIEIECLGGAVGEHRAAAGMNDGGTGGGERHRAGDHFITAAQPEGIQRQVQRGGARVHPHRMAGTDEAGEGFFELRGAGSDGDPSRAQRIDNRCDFLLPDVGTIERDFRLPLFLLYHVRAHDLPFVSRSLETRCHPIRRVSRAVPQYTKPAFSIPRTDDRFATLTTM